MFGDNCKISVICTVNNCFIPYLLMCVRFNRQFQTFQSQTSDLECHPDLSFHTLLEVQEEDNCSFLLRRKQTIPQVSFKFLPTPLCLTKSRKRFIFLLTGVCILCFLERCPETWKWQRSSRGEQLLKKCFRLLSSSVIHSSKFVLPKHMLLMGISSQWQLPSWHSLEYTSKHEKLLIYSNRS